MIESFLLALMNITITVLAVTFLANLSNQNKHEKTDPKTKRVIATDLQYYLSNLPKDVGGDESGELAIPKLNPPFRIRTIRGTGQDGGSIQKS